MLVGYQGSISKARVARGCGFTSALLAGLFSIGVFLIGTHGVSAADTFQSQIRPLLNTYCLDCHSGDDPNGAMDFSLIDSQAAAEREYEIWARVVELVESGEMPPEDNTPPTLAERTLLSNWVQDRFIDNVTAQPGIWSPRRLSAREYRRTLQSLFGFDLELAIIEAEQTVVEKSLVLKLLPTDPPGQSGFCNDTHSNPLSTQIWEQYSYLVDRALDELFSPRRQRQLAEFTSNTDGLGSVEHLGLAVNDSVLGSGPGDPSLSPDAAIRLMKKFLPRALRRTPTDQQLSQILARIASRADTVAATQAEMKTVLMSPAFIYRGLLMDGKRGYQQRVDGFELAERLSYFLWADMPDDALFALAASGRLGEPDILAEQVERLLDAPKSRSLADEFARQWLSLDDIEQVSVEVPYLAALKSQPREFMNYLFAEDRPLVELIDSEVTFANPLLRKFYGKDLSQLPNYQKPKGIEVEIVPLRKIRLEATQGRGGLLSLPGIVAMNRGPIIRGTWMLERILGEELPDPPANVGQVQPNQPGESLSFRERFELHRSNATCGVCHNRIDPLGFALDAYDREGRFRRAADYKPSRKLLKAQGLRDDSPAAIDASGQLPSGEQFEDFVELKQILTTTRREQFVRNLAGRLLAYALCRKLEYFDQPALDEIVDSLKPAGTYRELVHAIVGSLPFRETFIPGVTP